MLNSRLAAHMSWHYTLEHRSYSADLLGASKTRIKMLVSFLCMDATLKMEEKESIRKAAQYSLTSKEIISCQVE
jgi:hypothetical protein